MLVRDIFLSVFFIFILAVQPALTSANMAERVGCFDCHRADKSGSGPSFSDIAARYRANKEARGYLINIVKHGGKGAWNSITRGAPMPPYSPRISDENIEALVDWIQSQ